MAQMGAETLMGEGKWEGTVRAGLFFSPACLHAIALLPVVAACGVFLSYAVLQTVIFSHHLLVSNVVGLVVCEFSSTVLCEEVGLKCCGSS